MNDYTLTAGQQDILRGTYSPEFINRNAMCFAVEAPALIDDSQIEIGIAAMFRQHPVLRMIPIQNESEWRQLILAPEMDWEQIVIREEVEPEILGERMTELVTTMIEEFDVFDRPSWGVIRLRSGSVDHLIFVFNHILTDLVAVSHFIRTFITTVAYGGQGQLVPDTYVPYLEALESEWVGPPSDEARWWIERPWGEIPRVPHLHQVSGPPRAPQAELVVAVGEQDLLTGRLSEELLINAVEQSIRDVAGVPTTRIDVARVGRNNHRERFASGWLSHALPFVTTNASSGELVNAREKAASWIPAFRRVRARADLTTEDHFSAQVFVNFFGTFSPNNWRLEGFHVSTIQPAYQIPGRSSLTPLHLKVRKAGGDWLFSWSLSPQYEDTEMLSEMSNRTRQLLVSA